MNKPASYRQPTPRLLEEMQKMLSEHQTGPAYEKLKARLNEEPKIANDSSAAKDDSQI